MHDLEASAREVVRAWDSGDLAGAMRQLAQVLLNQDLSRSECATEVACAREMYADDQCVIDPEPLIAQADDGVYVAAWLWVPNP